MSTSITHVSKPAAVIRIVLLALFTAMLCNAGAAEPAGSQAGPVIKNLMPLSYRAPVSPARRDVKHLIAAVESPQDHLKLSTYYRTRAAELDVQAAGYEETAAALRNGPLVKNLTAPTTAARYEFLAKEFREEAKSNRTLAASQEEMAKTANRRSQ